MIIRAPETLSPLERLALIDISYSRLSTFDRCGAQYFYTYIVKEERVFGPAATLGNVLHSVLEDTVGEVLDLPHMLERMHHHREVFDPDNLIPETLMGKGHQMLVDFVDTHKDDVFNVVGKEVPFSMIIGSARINGFMDLVTYNNDAIIICDYKSGSWEVAKKNIATDLQLGMYALAASYLFPNRPIYAELYYLRSGRRKGHTFTEQDLEEVYYLLLEKVHNLINSNTFHYTRNERNCISLCDFSKNGVCSVGSYRLEKKGLR